MGTSVQCKLQHELICLCAVDHKDACLQGREYFWRKKEEKSTRWRERWPSALNSRESCDEECGGARQSAAADAVTALFLRGFGINRLRRSTLLPFLCCREHADKVWEIGWTESRNNVFCRRLKSSVQQKEGGGVFGGKGELCTQPVVPTGYISQWHTCTKRSNHVHH